MRTAAAEPVRPYRWDLTRPEQLGSLLDRAPVPDLWYRDQLVTCAAQVVARSGGGDLVFVGRSPDSLHDLLTGLLDGTGLEDRLHRFAFCCQARWPEVTAYEVACSRAALAAAGVTPATLAGRPVAFVDFVWSGTTLGNVYALVRDWVTDERVPWHVARRKLRFTGITERERPSPNVFRWDRELDWAAELRPSSLAGVAVDEDLWRYLAESQPKLTRSFRPAARKYVFHGPRHDERTRQALAEAVALVSYGRTRAARKAFVEALVAEPPRPWLRDVVTRVSGRGRSRSGSAARR